MSMKVLSVTSEIYPLKKTGGLADVCGALPLALKAEGVATRSLVPGYPEVMAAFAAAEEIHAVTDLFGGPARVLAATVQGLDLFIIDAPHLYDRPGDPYIGPDGKDWPDNAFRFAGLAKVAAAIATGAAASFVPDVVHAHDWEAGLTPAYLRFGTNTARPATVFTIHNLAFQGQFPAALRAELGLPPESFAVDGIEHYGAIGFLKAALQLSDWITTVSPTYANEIQHIETGMGLDGLLRERMGRLSGILNGIDTDVWNPAADTRLAANFDADDFGARARNKAALQRAMGLNVEPQALLTAVIARLSWQKGLDLLLDALPVLLGENMQLAVLGKGDAELEAKFRMAAQAHPGQIGVHVGYNESLAHRIQAGADALLVPSRYEPCGLTQLAALHYGTVPVVARVGGLADTVIDANEMALAAGVATGLQYTPVTAEALAAALRKTAALYRDTATWATMQRNGMATDVSWRGPARRYAALYRQLVGA